MVESTYGTENFKYNEIKEDDFFNRGGDGGGEGEMHSHYTGKGKRGGVGGKESKSHNFKEAKNANKRRNEKTARADEKAENIVKEKWMAEEERKWGPVDKKDKRHADKMNKKNEKKVKKAKGKEDDEDMDD